MDFRTAPAGPTPPPDPLPETERGSGGGVGFRHRRAWSQDKGVSDEGSYCQEDRQTLRTGDRHLLRGQGRQGEADGRTREATPAAKASEEDEASRPTASHHEPTPRARALCKRA